MNTIWKLLDGKKTIIAEIYWGVVMPSLVVIYPDGTPPDVAKVVTIIGLLLTSAGLGHKAVKKIAG